MRGCFVYGQFLTLYLVAQRDRAAYIVNLHQYFPYSRALFSGLTPKDNIPRLLDGFAISIENIFVELSILHML